MTGFVTSRTAIDSLMGPALRTQPIVPISPRQSRLRNSVHRTASETDIPTKPEQAASHPQTMFAQTQTQAAAIANLHSQRKRSRNRSLVDLSKRFNLASIVEADSVDEDLSTLIATNFSRRQSIKTSQSSPNLTLQNYESSNSSTTTLNETTRPLDSSDSSLNSDDAASSISSINSDPPLESLTAAAIQKNVKITQFSADSLFKRSPSIRAHTATHRKGPWWTKVKAMGF